MATVDRVLPWRHSVADDESILAPVLAAYRSTHVKASTDLIERAFAAADAAHEGQRRRSGEEYIYHPVAVATIVAELGLDDISVAAALLHDAVEDTGVTLEDVTRDFGEQVAELVDGVTKLDRVSFDSKEAQQSATMRKMVVAMAKDWRVLIIKLCDRLHNMRTLGAMPAHKQKRIAQETLDIYAPLAHRLGIQEVKWQLEDLSFATIHPKFYAEIEQMVATRAPERDHYLDNVLDEVRQRLVELGIHGEVTGRPKHYWSIYEKMVVRGKEFEEIFDLVGIRVIVESVKDCYAALGSIHSTWKPVQGRFKDYIAMPKFNLYQSLHTTVVGPQGKPLEVQIRTTEMHQRAERGVAAHWGYKEGASPTEDPAWLANLVDWQQETTDPNEFMQTLKTDLEQDEVFVFTPKGEVISMPTGATPIDYAYAIHTEVGHRCIGARVNGRLVPLDSKLSSGDKVEIFTSKVPTAGPSRDWQNIAITPRAQNKIRQWFTRERREDAVDTGRDELLKAYRREGLPAQKVAASPVLNKIVDDFNYADVDALYAAIGDGHVSAKSIAQRVGRELQGGDDPAVEDHMPATVTHPRRPNQRSTSGVHVEGLDDVMVRLSRCCTPVPGDDIVGFITRGRGVSVHRGDCANAVSLTTSQADRMIEVDWDSDRGGTFVASIEVKALDRSRLLMDVSKMLSEHHVNILSCTTHTASDRSSRMRFEFELADASHLESLLRAIKNIDSVYDAYRIVPGRS